MGGLINNNNLNKTVVANTDNLIEISTNISCILVFCTYGSSAMFSFSKGDEASIIDFKKVSGILGMSHLKFYKSNTNKIYFKCYGQSTTIYTIAGAVSFSQSDKDINDMTAINF